MDGDAASRIPRDAEAGADTVTDPDALQSAGFLRQAQSVATVEASAGDE